MTPRDIEKLKFLGYDAGFGDDYDENGNPYVEVGLNHLLVDKVSSSDPSDGIAFGWEKAKAHAQSPEGMKATMADKIAFLSAIDVVRIYFTSDHQYFAALGEGDGGPESHDCADPQTAVDALIWKVP